ncbi:Cleavage stimulation factor subunit 3 [Blomia tropicalis]|nr:Cleavage stimulation factor subunit 3 [Blomia tropicalis]
MNTNSQNANSWNINETNTDENTDADLLPEPLPAPGYFKNVSDRVLKARVKLVESPYDLDAWNILVKDAQGKPIDQAREFYEQLVSQFPTSGRFWKIYIEQEIKNRNYEKVEKLFQRSLIEVHNIDLWKCYLNYIKDAKANLRSFREKMGQAYDFALDKMGIDINSYSIYNDYVSFLKNVDAQGNYAENQKISAVRRVYQRGIIIPMLNIETFWKDYLAYESNINQMFVDKAIADRSKDYMNARRVVKEFEAITRGLNRAAPAVPPQSTQEEIRQVDLWKKYILWEKGNPLKSEDLILVIKRVVFAYEQCLLCLGHHPDIWYEYASYLDENSKLMAEKGDMSHHKNLQEDVATVYERATTTLLKENVLLHFSYADFEESRNRKDESIKIYEKLLSIDRPKFNPTLIYIQYMKFTRRTESINAARAVFKRARNDMRCSSEIYTSAALMEYYCSKDLNIACKIFELGLKKFPHESDFILSYIDFLSHLNEENNIRVLFERILSSDSLPLEKSLEIWNKFLEFESQIGDLPSVIKVEKRRLNVIEKLQKSYSETSWLVDRYRFGYLMPCTPEELKSIGYTFSNGTNVPRFNLHNNGESSLSSNQTPTICMPNLTQMVPFKPKQNPVNNLMPGGIFSYPPSIVSLLSQLPPPICFRGPFVNIDELMSMFQSSTTISLTDSTAKAESIDTSESLTSGNGTKRQLTIDDDDDGDGEGSNLMPPQFDIYRSRQLQKKPRN